MTELLLGTKKGLFVLEGEPGSQFEVRGRAFAGEPVDFAMRDPVSGRAIATTTSPFYGPRSSSPRTPPPSGPRPRESRCPRAASTRSSACG